uniref:Uncharacterized protein n=1 Tax=Chelonoidis abingdonii TaxID=106734 RepID=A0A8C0IKU3_CHEAB
MSLGIANEHCFIGATKNLAIDCPFQLHCRYIILCYPIIQHASRSLFRESPWRAGPVFLPAMSAGLAECSSHWLQFTAPAQWGLQEVERAEGRAGRPSCSTHWPGAVNCGQWELRSAEPAHAAGKQTGLAHQGLSLNK